MKKLIALVLTFVLMLSVCIPAFAAEDATTRSSVPTILIAGDGDPIYDANNKRLFRPSEIMDYLSNKDSGDDDNSEILKSVANVLMPFLVEGIAFDRWDNYYNNLQKEISELFSDVILDNNGEVVNGTGISKARKDYMAKSIKTDKADKNGEYGLYDYRFWYDWRLDPTEVADDFHAYIESVKSVTKKDKVAIVGRCLGTSVVLAYVAKYGTDSIHGVAFYGSVAAGAEIISEPISGKFNIDGNAIHRTMADYAETLNLHPFIGETFKLLENSGALDAVTDVVKEQIYYKVVEGVTSALALSTFFTWPNYWAAVSPEDYDAALTHVFGEEGSEKRTEYAGLIEKIERYDVLVRDNLTDIMKSFGEKGINVAILSKYGFQLLPICKSAEAVADEFTSAKRSSFGATTSTIYTKLTDDYIASLGEKSKYVSPDKRVDASTCLYPDSTWFVKGSSHTLWNKYEDEIVHTVATADRQLTVNDLGYTQYMVYDSKNDTMSVMTEDNCDTEKWVAREEIDKPVTKENKLKSFLVSIMNWFTSLFDFLRGMFS